MHMRICVQKLCKFVKIAILLKDTIMRNILRTKGLEPLDFPTKRMKYHCAYHVTASSCAPCANGNTCKAPNASIMSCYFIPWSMLISSVLTSFLLQYFQTEPRSQCWELRPHLQIHIPWDQTFCHGNSYNIPSRRAQRMSYCPATCYRDLKQKKYIVIIPKDDSLVHPSILRIVVQYQHRRRKV